MKNLLLMTVSTVALAAVAPAFSADLPAQPIRPLYTTAPGPVAAAIYDWSAYYFGVNGGLSSGESCWEYLGSKPEGCHHPTGGSVGLQIGYRWQMGQIVLGVEGQGNWADLTGSNHSIPFSDTTNQTKIDAFGLMTGQIGYAFGNNVLYGKGGAAVTSNIHQISSTVAGAARKSDVLWGGVLGVGFEHGIAPNWTVGFEYDHLFFQPRTVKFSGNIGGADRIREDLDLITVRVNYKFGGPILLKY
ncbi:MULTISPECIES: outer membrane protein [Bradyrhizobium]|uniref:Outer membrane protein beta-barrel domain-containing protein n=1 Tax=Bradyrhizobium canariense TaxID=255045 RepID=A0ABX3X1W9_9BRAD|nr:outer membrane beta-barrel protein [Bradyrhizobium canariense]MBM7485138.1 outer membrane immunogenic protein [Bradyrhizobium canariense]OSI31154.1 hypothetical protein BST65_06060 [Bradyrhizobium canariense]OSI36575.1 hypothetical protein BST66_06200 [Bradyrhizobium canariense]OSI46960.1 hypothetical protein BSZ20_10090 [Bradyrhizobium canariense]OSI54537.1 hypothetical protein BST67_07080 [Bradyrhizobium canariense]